MGYYMGDYYAGDPGFFSFLGKVAKTAVGFIPGVGPAARSAIDVLGGLGGKVAAKVPAPIVAAGKNVGRAVLAHPVLSAAGAAGAVGAIGGGMARAPSATATPAAAGLASMRRMRGGGGGRRRRMRVTNPKALRRAIRRAEGFKRLALRVLRFSGPHRPRGRAYFKPRKRRK